MKRVFLIVLDSVGIGEMPDAADYGDAGSNTIKAADASTLSGNLVVMTITFTKQETVDFLSKVAPDLVPEIDDPAFKSFFGPWTLKGGDRVTKYPDVESVSYVGLQGSLMENLERIAENWYSKLTK